MERARLEFGVVSSSGSKLCCQVLYTCFFLLFIQEVEMGVHTVVVGLRVVVRLAEGRLADFYGNHGVGPVDEGVWCLVG